MLKSTFLHIPGITQNTEITLWNSNILCWDDFLEKSNKLDIRAKERVLCKVEESIEHYNNKNHSFFSSLLTPRNHWRAYRESLRDKKCCFLDIETTGLSRYCHDITTIGVFDGKKSKVFINGKNLDDFAKEIKKYSMIITFNGTGFDLPFIRQKYPAINFNHFHTDLRWSLRELGFSGGLKKIEKEFGIDRQELDGVDGLEAVRLWKRYKRGDDAALDLLVKYNLADVENLKHLMDFAFEKLREKHFLSVIQ